MKVFKNLFKIFYKGVIALEYGFGFIVIIFFKIFKNIIEYKFKLKEHAAFLNQFL